jgi:hypothetical protein
VDKAAIFLRKNPATFIFPHPIKEVSRCGKFSENGILNCLSCGFLLLFHSQNTRRARFKWQVAWNHPCRR